MSLKLQVAQGLKWQAINIVGRQLLSFAVFTTLARLLDPTSFGLVGLVSVYLGFASLLAEQGIGSSLIQRKNLEPEHLDAAFWFNFACSFALFLLTLIFASSIADLLGEPKLVPLLRWSSLGLLISSLSAIHSTLFIKELDFRRPVIRTLIANGVGGAVGIGMALANYGVWALVGQQLALSFAGLIFLWIVSPYRPSMRFSKRHLGELLNVSSSVLASSLIHSISSKLDQIFIGRFSGAPALGLYVIAGKIPELSRFLISTPLAEVSLPAMSRLQDDHAKMRQVVQRGMELNAILSFAIFMGIASVASDLVPFLFGSKWNSAGTLCSLLSVYMMFNTLSVFIHPILVASGGAGKYVLLNIFQAIGILISCLVGVRFGANYLVIGLIFNGLLLTFPALVFLRNRMGLQILDYCRPCFMPAAASTFMAATVWGVSLVLPAEVNPGLRLLLKILIGAVIYISFVFFFKRAIILDLWGMVKHTVAQKRVVSP